MAEYRTPLPALLAGALEAAVNRVLALDGQSVARLEKLEGKVLQLDLEGLAITLYFRFAYGNVAVTLDAPGAPDAKVSGTPAALFDLAAEEAGAWESEGSRVRIEGDAALARDLGKVFAKLDPDWQAPLDELFGDTLGYQLSEGLRRGAAGLRDAFRGALDMGGRYLRDESDVLAPREDIDAFNTAVDDLRDGVDRLETRLARIERRRNAPAD